MRVLLAYQIFPSVSFTVMFGTLPDAAPGESICLLTLSPEKLTRVNVNTHPGETDTGMKLRTFDIPRHSQIGIIFYLRIECDENKFTPCSSVIWCSFLSTTWDNYKFDFYKYSSSSFVSSRRDTCRFFFLLRRTKLRTRGHTRE